MAAELTRKERAARRREIAKFVKNGASFQEAARKFDMCTASIHSACKENGVPNPNPTGFKASTYAILADLQNTDLSYDEIGKRHEVSRSRVDQILQNAKRAGMLFPNRRGG